jgi:CDP-glycerol glycerophosphotransferase (TagB/SpsB family)
MPRNDAMFVKNRKVTKLIKNYDKFIIWLPTYKKHKNVKELDYKINKNVVQLFKDNELEELNEKLKTLNTLLILKYHPAEDLSKFEGKEFSHLKLWKNEELIDKGISLYSLLGQSDALITDYSSVYPDYLLMDKQVAFIEEDMSLLKNKRGLVFDNIDEYAIGDKLKTKEDFIKFVKNISKGKDKYQKERNKIKDFYHKYQSGNSCEIITKIFDL